MDDRAVGLVNDLAYKAQIRSAALSPSAAPANIDQNGELVYGQFLVSGFFNHGHDSECYYVDSAAEALSIARSMLERGLERVMVEDVFALRANAEAASL